MRAPRTVASRFASARGAVSAAPVGASTVTPPIVTLSRAFMRRGLRKSIARPRY
jgi:hypothetical protein